jgi:hypothetical protein
MKKNNDLASMEKWQFWERALMSGDKKVKLKTFSDVEEEKCYLFKRMMADKASAQEIMRLSFLRGVTSKEEYADFLDICARYPEDSEEED